ncbi:MAG: agmatinase [Deltaproteobacteria bacterium]|nr:agmatinase [Deltaproteobacteria bacterium]
MNFGGLNPEYSSFERATFVVVPVPYDLTSTYQAGSRKGPSAILDASCQMELYDEELRRETFRAGIHTVLPLEVRAGGPQEMIDYVRNEVAEILSSGKIPVILGGEHSISLGPVQAMKETYPSLSVLHLDAHADMRNSYQGTPYSHACVSRRISEICHVVQVGIRSMSAEEAVFIEENTVTIYYPDFLYENPQWEKTICGCLSEDVYITIDLDVFDPSIMPAVGTPEPGGLYWKDITRLIREVSNNCRIRGFDIVELTPIPGIVAPDFTAAKLAYRVMGYIDSKNKDNKGDTN